ncbi:hypothetical protein C3E98_022165 [Pseudomonas sp. MWU13-2625]|nr:hypothetical protein [Pseudomonas sp. TH49]MBK5341870.1 hypothetical protein [Pseudomonas sp. TH49]RBL69146.1 hypothetical protein C3E98_022165 [Pseudomonas sp. MWU13-2625]
MNRVAPFASKPAPTGLAPSLWEQLGVSRNTLYRKLRKHAISR